MAFRRRNKSYPFFSQEFLIQNHADIVFSLVIVILIGLMFEVRGFLNLFSSSELLLSLSCLQDCRSFFFLHYRLDLKQFMFHFIGNVTPFVGVFAACLLCSFLFCASFVKKKKKIFAHKLLIFAQQSLKKFYLENETLRQACIALPVKTIFVSFWLI